MNIDNSFYMPSQEGSNGRGSARFDDGGYNRCFHVTDCVTD